MADDQATWRKNLPEDFDGRHGDGKEWDSEIPIKPILWSTVAITLALIFALVFNWQLIEFMAARQPDSELSPIAEANERRLPPRPWLQPRPEMELDAYLDEVEAQKEQFGWIDALDERVRIPIELATTLVLEEHHAAASSPIEPAADPSVDAAVDGDLAPVHAGDEHGDPHG